MTRILEIAELSAGYDGATVVRGLNLTVDRGQVVALLGPNGAGKTTTLLAVSGLVPVMSGSVRFLGTEVRTRRAHRLARKGLSHVPEDRGVFRGLTVAQHLRIGASRPDVAYRYFPELQQISGRRVGLLSGGEQQMVAIGRALGSGPQLLVVDEMSLGLAPIIVQRLLRVVRKVADDLGCGVLLVEQHVNLALGMADDAYVLNHGDLVTRGRASDLIDNRAVLESAYMGDGSLAALA